MSRPSSDPRVLPLTFLALLFGLIGLGLWLAPAAPVAANDGPALVITKSAEPDPVSAGGVLTYTLTITNVGDATATGTRVTDTLPVSVTFGVATDGCTYDGSSHVVICLANDLQVVEEKVLTVVVTVDPSAGQTIVNTATVSADEVDPVSAVAETTVHHPGLSITKWTATPVIRSGETVAYTITVTNTGDVELLGVTVTDAGVPACGQSLGSLASGAITTYTCSVLNVTADLTNTAVVSGTPPVGAVVTATGSATVDVINPEIALTKRTATPVIRSGETVAYTITVTNTGDVELLGVTVTDAGVPACGQSLGSLASGAMTQYTCSVLNVTADLTNTAVVSGTPLVGSVVTDTASATVDVINPAIALTKRTATPVIRSGDTVGYTITVTNTGDVALEDVTVTDAAEPACGRSLGSLARSAITQYTCSLANVTEDLTNTAVVSGTSPVGSVVTATASATVDVINPAIALMKRTATPVIRSGETVAYTITVTNTGDVALSGVTVTDAAVPACGQSLGLLASSAITTYTCSALNVTADLTNTAVVSGTPAVGSVVTAMASATVDVINPALMVSKLPNTQMLRGGETALFTIIVTNTGDVPLTNVTRVDPLAPLCGGVISDLAPGSYAVNYCSRSNVRADFTNTITVSAKPRVGSDVVSSDSAYVDVIGPSVVLNKSPASQMVRPGGTALFTITVTNSGDVDLQDASVVDPSAPGCARTIGALVKGTPFVYTCTVSPVAVSFTNVATVTATPPDVVPISDTAEASVTLINPAVVAAKLPASQTVRVGDPATFTIRVTNTGNITLTGVAVSDALAPDCTRAIGTLAPLGSAQYTCSRSAVTAGFTNVITATGKPPVGPDVTSSASAQVLVISPALRISKEPDLQTVRAGDPVTFTIVVTNMGDAALAGVSVIDAAAPTCARSIGYLDVAGSSRYTCTAQNVITGFTNVATATGSVALGGIVTDTDNAVVVVVVPAPTRHDVYLPVVLKAEPRTELYVTTENTGGVSRLELWRTGDSVRVHMCENLPDNTVGYPCGAFAPGSYRIEAHTVRCGLLTAQRTWGPGPVTIRVFCR